MSCTGELRGYVGGRYEFEERAHVLTMVWRSGNMVCKGRYNSKADRRKMIDKMVDTWGDVEVAILPDAAEEL